MSDVQSPFEGEAPRYSAETTLSVTNEEKPTIAKAVIAGVTALGGLFVTALTDGHITATEYVSIVVGTIVAAASVWAVTNKRS